MSQKEKKGEEKRDERKKRTTLTIPNGLKFDGITVFETKRIQRLNLLFKSKKALFFSLQPLN